MAIKDIMMKYKKQTYIACGVFAVVALAIAVEVASLSFNYKDNELNAIETAAFAGNLSKFQEYLEKNQTLQAERDRWLTIKQNDFRKQCEEKTRSVIEQVALEKLPLSVITDVSFSGTRKDPQRGVWVESYRVEACDMSRQINIGFYVQPNKGITSVLLLNGTSLAKPSEQADGYKHASGAARATRLDCANWVVDNTEYLGAVPDRTDGSWEEEWTLKGCGSSYRAQMIFTPNTNPASEFGTQVKANRLVKDLPGTY